MGDIIFSPSIIIVPKRKMIKIEGEPFGPTVNLQEAIIGNAKITTAMIQDLAVVEGKIGNLAVTNAKINDLDAVKITAGDITTARLQVNAANAVNAGGITISGTKIELTSATTKTGEWHNQGGVTIDATKGINIYGLANALTTRATKEGTIQCYVGVDGKLYAGAGAVILDSGGVTIKGQKLIFQEAGGTLIGYALGYNGCLNIVAASGKGISIGRNVWGTVNDRIAITAGSGSFVQITGDYCDLSGCYYMKLADKNTDPSGAEGMMYYNYTTHTLKVHNGTAWKTVTWT